MPTLDWLNRAEALTLADKVPYRVLEPVSEFFSPRPQAGEGLGVRAHQDNLLIQGDNLDALKALLPFYRSRVKCIFIDPPYNTKSAFEHYDDNLEHSQWLSMMYPRLVLLRELLHESGSIWVTIDDNEGHYLKVLMDELFSRSNFVANVFWQKTPTRENRTDISTVHDHILLYAKNRDGWKEIRNPLPSSEEQLERFTNPDNDPRGVWASLPAHAKAEKGRREAQFFTITTPSGRKVDPPAGRCWLYTEPRFHEMVQDGRIWFGEDGGNVPRVKKFLTEVQEGLVPSTFWAHSEVGTNGQAKSEITQLFPGDVPFSTPKPERLLQRIIHISTNPGDLVLDSFLGSGTTAAVAHKMGRRWIGIEMGEHAVTHDLPRLQKVIDGEQGGISPAVNWQGGGGFRFLRLGEAMFNADGSIHPAVRFATLASFVWMQETGMPLVSTLDPNPSHRRRPVSSQSENLDSGLRRNDEGGVCRNDALDMREGNKTPLLGVHEGRGIYLLFNGILGDKRPASGNVLTNEVLATLDRLCPHAGPRIIYGEACRLGAARLETSGVTFKHIPYDVKAR